MLVNPWHFHPPYVSAMCPRCQTVHTAVPLAVVLRDCTSRDELAQYYACTKCGLSTSKLVYAGPDDAPPGHVGPTVVAGFPPDIPAQNGEKRTLYFETSPKDGQELLTWMELYVARSRDFYPMRFRIYGIDIDDDIVRSALSAPDPLTAARDVVRRSLDYFD